MRLLCYLSFKTSGPTSSSAECSHWKFRIQRWTDLGIYRLVVPALSPLVSNDARNLPALFAVHLSNSKLMLGNPAKRFRNQYGFVVLHLPFFLLLPASFSPPHREWQMGSHFYRVTSRSTTGPSTVQASRVSLHQNRRVSVPDVGVLALAITRINPGRSCADHVTHA